MNKKHIKTFESYDSDFDKSFKKALTDGLPTDEFWDFVKKVDWQNTNYENRRYKESFLMNNISPTFTYDDMLEFEKIYNTLDKKLDSVLKREAKTSGLGVSDAGYWDLKSSIIGYGRDFYISIIKDKTFDKVRKMSQDNDYHENFSYIFGTLSMIGREKWDQIN